LIRLPGGRLRGDNTDWIGIRECLLPHLRARTAAGADGGKGAGGLVLGAGGTARAALYALRAMGVSPLYAWNRTAAKAAALAAEFGAEVRTRAAAACDGRTPARRTDSISSGAQLSRAPAPHSTAHTWSRRSLARRRAQAVTDLASFAPAKLTLVVGTTPGSAGVTLPAALLAAHTPAVLDAAYIPRMTPLLTDAAAAGCALAFGAEMLFEQGCAQFTLWTGRVAPRKAMATAISVRIAEPSVPLPPLLRRAMDGDC
jgi:pentafunctional AROM polypeptide